MRERLRTLLTNVAEGRVEVDEAVRSLKHSGYVDLGYARVDVGRAQRRGIPEVIFGEGKASSHIAGLIKAIDENEQQALATRISASVAAEVRAELEGLATTYDAAARCLYTERYPVEKMGQGKILVVSAGTADEPVAAEAALAAQLFGNDVERLSDVGVAGIHRILNETDRLRSASVVIVCAGLEGALPSVVAGLVARPVIAVPTSVGYGVSLDGLAALMGMLSACSAGVTVVNIDNGFGAAYAASLMNRRWEPQG